MEKKFPKVNLFHSCTFWVKHDVASRESREDSRAEDIIFGKSGWVIHIVSNLTNLLHFLVGGIKK